jgi:hypothetical protein
MAASPAFVVVTLYAPLDPAVLRLRTLDRVHSVAAPAVDVVPPLRVRMTCAVPEVATETLPSNPVQDAAVVDATLNPEG